MSEDKYDALEAQIRQHEQTITQLVAIIAATNRRLSELDRKQNEELKTSSLT